MVNDSAQLYTIEGVAAAVLMLVTAYIVITSTTVLTPQDVHIIDVQLETLGNDALAIMDIRNSSDDDSSLLQQLIRYDDNSNKTRFRETFLLYCNSTPQGNFDNLQFDAKIFYRGLSGDVQHYSYDRSSQYYREKAVQVSRWVYLDNKPDYGPGNMRSGQQIVLLEVLLWRS